MSEQVFNKIAEFCTINESQKQALVDYVQLLLKWNKSINLIGKATEEDIWNRHILDGAQLVQYIPKDTKIITDLGSGAGLPAIILAILLDGVEVRAIESVSKKASFMREAARITKANLIVYDARIEELKPWASDVITARAFAPLNQLLKYVQLFIDEKSEKETLSILPKGCKLQKEIKEAQKNWQFDYKINQSILANDSFVLEIRGLNGKKS